MKEVKDEEEYVFLRLGFKLEVFGM